LQALCDGILDASILTIYEGRWRKPEKHEAKWLDHQAGKVERALAVLEAAPPVLDPVPGLPHVGQIALACALGYRDFRFRRQLGAAITRVSSLGSMALPRACPAFAATAPKA
jgi:glutathione S-transferase